MPELPEVERGRTVAERVAAGRRITNVRCANDAIVFQTPVATVRRSLKGRRVKAVHRRGKYLFFELDKRPWPLMHFGMTGAFRTPDEEPIKLASSKKRKTKEDDVWPPRFTKFHLTFDDGGELVMTNARRLGRVKLLDDPLTEGPIAKLGFDALIDMPTPAAFAGMLAKRKAPMKALLLDQSFAAGVGNWIADEILYQAKIDPHRRANELTPAEAKCVHTKLRSIIAKAVSVNGENGCFPRTWLFHRRWGKVEGATTVDGAPIVHTTLGGRTTAWVPSKQA